REGRLERIDRASDWGNPYVVGKDGDRGSCCDAYPEHFRRKPSLQRRTPDLRGEVLLCHCHPERCHGHYLAALANGDDLGQADDRPDDEGLGDEEEGSWGPWAPASSQAAPPACVPPPPPPPARHPHSDRLERWLRRAIDEALYID